jgi:gag-polyprotein putative aspartyl protease
MSRPNRLARLAAALVAALAAPATYGECIPLRSEGGTFVVPVLINDKITLDFTVDSGAAEVSIPLDVFSTLQRTHTISESDLLPPAEFTMADGSVHRETRFRIRSLRVGGFELHDVVGSVAPPRGTLLLGQSFLSRLPTWSVDNRRHVLVISESIAEGTPPGAQAMAQVPPILPQAPPAPSSDKAAAASRMLDHACKKEIVTLCGHAHGNELRDCVKAGLDLNGFSGSCKAEITGRAAN